jgi:hypothetical protein
MGVPDLVRYFDDAMVGSEKYGYMPISPFLFGRRWNKWSNELHPFRFAVKVTRFGRSGSDEDGELGDNVEGPDRVGGGDLSLEQVDSDEDLIRKKIDYYYGYLYDVRDKKNDSFRGYERPRVYGPDDYHRIAAFGVASFQVDWTDGRRKPDEDGRQWAYYPPDGCQVQNTNPGEGSYNRLGGPGPSCTYCWNYFAPTTVRESMVLKHGRGGVCLYEPEKSTWGPYVQYAWRLGQSGSFPYGADAWPWPKALRIRITMAALEDDQPVAYAFERVFYLNVQ